MTRRPVLGVLVLACAVGGVGAPSDAGAAISARSAIKTRDGATRLLVTVASKRPFTARSRPRGVKVVARTASYVLRRGKTSGPRTMWGTRQMRGAKGAALGALAGHPITIRVRTLAGTTTLRAWVAPPRTPPPAARDPGAAPRTDGDTPLPKGEQALAVAERYLGTPFAWGGASPATGFDSPGLTQYSYRQVGIDLPRLAETQFQVGNPVARASMRVGDLTFFEDGTGYVDHVGIFAGNRKFIHAPRQGDVVKVSSLAEAFYDQRFAGARRVAD